MIKCKYVMVPISEFLQRRETLAVARVATTDGSGFVLLPASFSVQIYGHPGGATYVEL